jgi:GR25 family glycosyltransferase involved in LPS biosynthesis
MRQNFVITIQDIEQSVQAAKRCIRSGQSYGATIKHFDAITPRNTNLIEMCKEEGIDTAGFREVYSRFDNCVAAFLSHYSLWKQCAKGYDDYLILEHDAVVVNQLNSDIKFDMCCNIGKPSYGKFNNPSHIGVGQLQSKRYFGGAHAYLLSPKGAKELIRQAKIQAKPTDVFLHLDTFPWLQETNPYIVEANDSFTTIQQTQGCLAKHNYGETYEIL